LEEHPGTPTMTFRTAMGFQSPFAWDVPELVDEFFWAESEEEME